VLFGSRAVDAENNYKISINKTLIHAIFDKPSDF